MKKFTKTLNTMRDLNEPENLEVDRVITFVINDSEYSELNATFETELNELASLLKQFSKLFKDSNELKVYIGLLSETVYVSVFLEFNGCFMYDINKLIESLTDFAPWGIEEGLNGFSLMDVCDAYESLEDLEDCEPENTFYINTAVIY